MQTDLKELLRRMMDENDWEPIVLINDRGDAERFDQVALLPVSVESRKYVDETVEHNFAILQPIDDAGEELGRSIIVDITIDEDQNYRLSLVDNPLLVHIIMVEYRDVRGITPDDLAINNEGNEDAPDGEDDLATEEPEAAEGENAGSESEKEDSGKGFFARLFGKKKKH